MDDSIHKSLEHLSEEADTQSGHSIVRPMVLSLIQSSYLRTHTLTDFAQDVVDIVSTAVTVPMAFAEGFLRSFLAIEAVEEDRSGHVRIKPRPGASEEEIIRDVDEIAARIDPSAVYNPVVRRQLDRVAEASGAVMREDLESLSSLSAEELHSALERLEPVEPVAPRDPSEAQAVRARLEQVRSALRRYQAGGTSDPATGGGPERT